ncbi:hypothetical protein GCM10027044_36080 [Hymenobacter ruber]
MPLHMQRRPSTAQEAAAETSQSYTAPRFWKLKDSAYVKAAAPFYQYVGRRFTWPSSTFKAGIEGQITVRLILRPDGTVSQAEIAQRALKQAAGYIPEEGLEKGTAALEAEALQFMKKLRFEPAATTDTITVPLSLRMQ